MKNLTDFHKTVETGVDPRLFIVARGNPQPLHLNNSPEWKKEFAQYPAIITSQKLVTLLSKNHLPHP